MEKLTNEQKNNIVNEYGSNIEVIEKIEEILSVQNFTDEEYIEILLEIVSEYESNAVKSKTGASNTYYDFKEIIKKVLIYKYDAISGYDTPYENELLKTLKRIKKLDVSI